MTVKSNHDIVSAYQVGQTRVGTFRKVPSLVSTAYWWFDLGMSAGSPPANYYASNPLKAALLDKWDGLYHGDNVGPSDLYLTDLMIVASSANCVGLYTLCDYLLYYPFIDLDSVDKQDMDNTTTLTRNTTGAGTSVMVVAQSPTTGGGSFTMTYINQDGIEKTTPINYYSVGVAGMGSLLTIQPATANNSSRFVLLDQNDTGVRQILSVTNLVSNGGLGCFVIVRPLVDLTISEVNVPTEITLLSKTMQFPNIPDGAFLSFICNTAGSLSAQTIVGRLNFIWN